MIVLDLEAHKHTHIHTNTHARFACRPASLAIHVLEKIEVEPG